MPLVVIGLGNPGEEYAQHRHNIGFQVIDRLAALCGGKIKKPHFLSRFECCHVSYQGRPLMLVKPLTFMNKSGEIIKNVLRRAQAVYRDLVIVCDSLDLELGVLKLKLQGSSGGHRGLESIFAHLKRNDVARFSIGIGRPARRGGVISHVLGDPDGEEAIALEKAVEQTAGFILRLLREPKEKIMNEANRRTKSDA